jgi:glycosyltransferase involved in cell wall biosynthesis
VHFLGERQDIPEILSDISIYVQASSFEGMANSLIEAIAAGCLVLVSAIDENLELVGKGERGWIFEPKNPASLANVLAEPQKTASYAKSARRYVTELYLEEKMLDALNLVIESESSQTLGQRKTN